SLVFNADGVPLLVLTSGAHRVDTGRVAELVGASKVKRADPDFVRQSTGQVIGGGGPVRPPAPLRPPGGPPLRPLDRVPAPARAGPPAQGVPALVGRAGPDPRGPPRHGERRRVTGSGEPRRAPSRPGP